MKKQAVVAVGWALVALIFASDAASQGTMVDGVLQGVSARRVQDTVAEDRAYLKKKRDQEDEDRAWVLQQRQWAEEERRARTVATGGAAVVLQSAGEGEVGKRLATALKDRLALGIGFRPALSTDRAYLILSLLTIDTVAGSSDSSTAYSVSFQFGMDGERKGRHLSHRVGICGRDAIDSCAVKILTNMSAALDADVRQ